MDESHPIPIEVSRPSITLPTATGPVQLVEATEPHQCSGCGRSGGGMAEIHVDRAGERVCIPICGNCVCSAVGVHIRRRHGLPAPAKPESRA